MTPNLTITTGEVFSLLAQSYSQLDKVPRRPLRYDGAVQENEEGKEDGESCWRSGGGRGRLYN
jgi:hypothetical protein